jgi:hypothetical protein
MPKISEVQPNLTLRNSRFKDVGTFHELNSVFNNAKQHFIALTQAVNDLALGPTLPTYTVAGVPAASANARRMIYVSDETGGAVPAFSDGTDWRRVTDRVVIS